jgi:ABC-2 type transport system permease protein
LRAPLGIALHLHRGPILGWALGAVVVSATFGALAQPIVDALAGNASLSEAMGAAGGAGLDAVLTMSALILALLVAAYAVQAIGVIRGEETSGRLEARLPAARGRATWLGTQLLVVLVGLVVVAASGGLALVVATAWSTGEQVAGPVAGAVASYLPATLVLAGLALLMFGLFPRAQPVAWLGYGAAALIGYLGEPLQLPQAVVALSPFHYVGSPPQEDVDAAGHPTAVTRPSCLHPGTPALAPRPRARTVTARRRHGVPPRYTDRHATRVLDQHLHGDP